MLEFFLLVIWIEIWPRISQIEQKFTESEQNDMQKDIYVERNNVFYVGSITCHPNKKLKGNNSVEHSAVLH